MRVRTADELEQAIKEIFYAFQQLTALRLFQKNIIPVLAEKNLQNEIGSLNNTSLESHLMFLRKLNEFFGHLPKEKDRSLREDDLRAEHYSGFESPGPVLSDQDEAEIHKRVGHITLIEVRHGPKDWAELVKSSMPIAVDRLLQFLCFLRDRYRPPLSDATRKDVQFLIGQLELIKGKLPAILTLPED
jgi:hypothetical protein